MTFPKQRKLLVLVYNAKSSLQSLFVITQSFTLNFISQFKIPRRISVDIPAFLS